VTEEDAKTKWCPQCARSVKGFIIGNPDLIYHCIASECMWWVWDDASDDGSPYNDLGHCGATNRQ